MSELLRSYILSHSLHMILIKEDFPTVSSVGLILVLNNGA